MAAEGRSTTAFAKTTRPEIGCILGRERLFARLDATPGRTLVWIGAPAGAGKSTLAASYVAARNLRCAWYQIDRDDDDLATFLHYLGHAVRRLLPPGETLPVPDLQGSEGTAAFARRHFRALFAALPTPFTLVLDNLHELAVDSELRVALEAGLCQVPRHGCVIITSRAAPWPAMSKLRLDGKLVCIDAEALQINAAEFVEIARLRGHDLGTEAAVQLHERTRGWAAAVVLFLEHAKVTEAVANPPAEAMPVLAFDYLAGEIFDRFEPATRDFLLRVACLPRMTIDVARTVAEQPYAGRLLLNLTHNGYFVREMVDQQRRVFEFHPLLREFLLRRAAAEMPQAVDRTTQQRAAAALRDAGQLEDAVALWIEAQDWPAVAAVVADSAETLLAQGRGATLARWIELLPAPLIENNPRLLLADASSRLHASPRAARRRFEQAFAAFRLSDARASLLRCACGVVEACLREFDDLALIDRWIDELLTLDAPRDAEARTTLARALLWRNPAHPELPACLAAPSNAPPRAADEPAVLATLRSIGALLRGDLAAAQPPARGVDAGDQPTCLRQRIALGHALHAFIDGNGESALRIAREALDAADGAQRDSVWLHALLAASALRLDDVALAREHLRPLQSAELRRGDRSILHALLGWQAAASGENTLAVREFRSAVLLAVEAGLPWFEATARVMLAPCLAAVGDRSGGEAQLRAAGDLAQRLHSGWLRCLVRFAEANSALEAGDADACHAPLRAALGEAKSLGLQHVATLRAPQFAALCAQAIEDGIDVAQARTLIRQGRFAPPAAAVRLRDWPWPFHITTLGGFALCRHGAPVESSAKGPGRPIELLKVLIAQGGQNVRAEQLADALWPNVDADYAHKSFTATLHRLRRLCEDDDALVLRDGRLSLNGSLFWVDTWALTQVLAQIDAALRTPDEPVSTARLRALTDRALALYAGPFLPDENEQPAYPGRREQLRSRVAHVLGRVARRFEECGERDAAIDCHLRCIDADDGCELFYRNLMLRYQQLGQRADVLAVHERLRIALAARSLGEPSAETRALVGALRE